LPFGEKTVFDKKINLTPFCSFCSFLEEGGSGTMNMMKYRGDTARIFVGHLAGIQDIVGFHGTTVDELEAAFHESVDNYIAISEETGRPAQKPYSGRLMLRVPSDVHAAVATAAQVRGKSINQWAADTLKKAARR
jgi:predicted HicB family RNase H-like nuclease